MERWDGRLAIRLRRKRRPEEGYSTVTIDDILELVGTLDDSPGDDSGRERFRKYLAKSATDLGLVRDYIESCLNTPGPQYNRALQDLVNHTARLMGFDVQFGRYSGVTNAIGFDGVWSHPSLHIVAEVKTTDAYTIKAATLVGYVDALISDQILPDWDHAIGVYVVGRADAGLQQLENAIVAEKRMQQLRVATVESVLSLAELVQGQLLTLDEAITIIRPRGVLIDDTVKLLSRVAAKPSDIEPPTSGVSAPGLATGRPETPVTDAPGPPGKDLTYFLTPVADEKEAPAEETIRSLLDQSWYVFGNTSPGRKLIKAGDHIAFYQTGKGVVASARVTSSVEEKLIPFVKNPHGYPWAFGVTDVRYFFDAPIAIDAALRSRLDAFKGRDPANGWAWFVQSTRFRLTAHDFALLTGTASDS